VTHTYVIAEAGVNHNGSLDRALDLIDAATQCGADAVKFQSFRPDELVSARARKAPYQEQTTGEAEGQLEMLRKLQLSAEDHRALLRRCRDRNIDFLSTPFDEHSLQMLVEDLGVQRLKLGSGDLTHGPLLFAAARTSLPLILSTGMATQKEIDDALGVVAFCWTMSEGEASTESFARARDSVAGRTALEERLVLLQCTTEYPAPFDEVNLRVMASFREHYGVNVGLSDHTPGIAIPLAAVALGATVVEKHFTLDKSLPGPDHRASLDPTELESMVEGIRAVEAALGTAEKTVGQAEARNRVPARRSLIAAQPIRPGEPFTARNLGAKRPGDGISPMRYWDVIGQTAAREFVVDEPISVEGIPTESHEHSKEDS